MPGDHCLDLLQAGIAAADHDIADTPLLLVFFVALHDDLFSKHQVEEVFLGALCEGLGFLRGVDAGQADFVLGIGRVQNDNSVAIRHAHHPPSN